MWLTLFFWLAERMASHSGGDGRSNDMVTIGDCGKAGAAMALQLAVGTALRRPQAAGCHVDDYFSSRNGGFGDSTDSYIADVPEIWRFLASSWPLLP